MISKAALFIYTGLNLEIKEGELIAVVGPVGCGKTTLLMSLIQVKLLNLKNYTLKKLYNTCSFINTIIILGVKLGGR